MLSEHSLARFLDTLASDAPAPGGGSMAAFSGAAAAGLIEMVAGLTIGKKGYEAVAEEMAAIKGKAAAARARLTLLIDEDAAAFDGVMAAFALPKATEEEKAARKAAVQTAFIHAARLPMETATLSASLLPLAEACLVRGNNNAESDATVAVHLIRTAVRGGLANVRINLSSIKDGAVVADLGAQADLLQSETERAVAFLLHRAGL